ncbi:MAG: CsiV family protein [Panacagrimonas sp.]
MNPRSQTLVALLFALLAPCAHAETWRVDLIVFRFLGGIEEVGRLPQAPNLQDAIELDDASGLSAAGITPLPESEFGLSDQWARLKSSPQFRPLMKLAWTQNDPVPTGGPRLRMHSTAKLKLRDEQGLGEREFYEIDGTVALHLGRYLHLGADLLLTVGGEDPQSWRLSEARRMRSDELHHLDSPRLGILVKVSKWGPGLSPALPAATP